MNRAAKLIGGLAVVFVATVAIISKLIPGPHKPTDYLVMGGIATILCLALLFWILMGAAGVELGALFRKRKNDPDQTSRTSTDL
ncbi:MAG TPA: hypothetical protein VKU01_15540 [Bryobacteraceae bacterium]|nr:hypothetical protein [Bryobacteraceae bacterium]